MFTIKMRCFDNCCTSILRYPRGRVGAIHLTCEDTARLTSGRWLNDKIIDFALKYVRIGFVF